MAAQGSKMTIVLRTRLFSTKLITEQIIAIYRYFMVLTFILGSIFLDPSFPSSYFVQNRYIYKKLQTLFESDQFYS